MFRNRKAQGMVIDLILLILIASLFFIILSSQLPHQAPEAGIIRSRSTNIQRTLISILNTKTDNTTDFPESQVIELIAENYCGKNTRNDLNYTIQQTMDALNKPNHHFIFISCVESDCSKSGSLGICSPEVESEFGSCCIETEKINIAKLKVNLPESCTQDFVDVQIGIWPEKMEVKACS